MATSYGRRPIRWTAACSALVWGCIVQVAGPRAWGAASTEVQAAAQSRDDGQRPSLPQAVAAPASPAGEPRGDEATEFVDPPMLIFDRIVAWVDGETISQNELFAETWLSQVELQGQDAASRSPSEAELQRHLHQLVGDLLVAREARRVGAEAPPSELVDFRLTQLLERFDSQQAYGNFVQQLGVHDGFVLDGIARKLFVERYLSQRLRTRLGPDHPAESTADAERTEREREQRLAKLSLGYRQELWRSVPIRMLRPSGALERFRSDRGP